MKILGNNKKDYFDYLIHQYGEDPLTILDRRPIGKFQEEYNNPAVGGYTSTQVDNKYAMTSARMTPTKTYTHDGRIDEFLVLNGKVYSLFLETDYPSKYVIANDNNTLLSGSSYFVDNYAVKEGVVLDKMVELHKQINRHCFVICGNRVQGVVPNLRELNFPSLKLPMEVYLETIDFINQHLTIKGESTTPQTNKEKIVGHGFDLKTSFRGK